MTANPTPVFTRPANPKRAICFSVSAMRERVVLRPDG